MPISVAVEIAKATDAGNGIENLFAKKKTKYALEVITAACAM
jgi:hypothetical protein